MALDLAQMVLDVRKNLKQTQFYLLNKLCYNNFAQNLSQKTKHSPAGELQTQKNLSMFFKGAMRIRVGVKCA